jgi:two-component system, NarL family, nitrate/nitrite response regulator NarL
VILKDVATKFWCSRCGRSRTPEAIANCPPSDQTVPREQKNVANTENVLTVLTDRERQVMRQVSEGLSNKKIGAPA